MNNIREFEFHKGSNKSLIITYAGYFELRERKPEDAIVYNFKNLLLTDSIYSKNDILFVRDLNNAWYLKGLKNENLNSIEETKNYFIDFIINNEYKDVFVLGSSAGGYASILFSKLINDKLKDLNIRCLAFSPQTDLNLNCKFQTGWMKDKIRKYVIDNNPNLDISFLNLKNVLNTNNRKFNYLALCSKQNIYDSTSLDNISNAIFTRKFDAEKEHNIAGWLKSKNKLKLFIDKFLTYKNFEAFYHDNIFNFN